MYLGTLLQSINDTSSLAINDRQHTTRNRLQLGDSDGDGEFEFGLLFNAWLNVFLCILLQTVSVRVRESQKERETEGERGSVSDCVERWRASKASSTEHSKQSVYVMLKIQWYA